jgi:hypothetical protein
MPNIVAIALPFGGAGFGSTGASSPTPPSIVAFGFLTGPGAGGAGAPAAPPPAGAGAVTTNECPHLGHRILSPAGGTRRSSIG